jgi:hypothetical protein
MEDKILSEEMIEKIHIETDHYLEKFYHGHYAAMQELVWDIKNCHATIMDGQVKVLKRLDEIEKMINSHAIGVQNVYDKFNKLLEEIDSKKEIDEGFRLEMAEFVRKRLKT